MEEFSELEQILSKAIQEIVLAQIKIDSLLETISFQLTNLTKIQLEILGKK